jgi:predicted ester cyclase
MAWHATRVSTPEDNKALVRRFIDALSTGDVKAAAECFDSERYYSHAHQADLAGTWERMKAGRRSSPWSDATSESVVLVADGDRVVHHSRFTATHSGDYLGVPASGNRIEFDHIEMWRIDNDKIVEHWGGNYEVRRLYEQLQGEST